MKSTMSADLRALARLCGVQLSYLDNEGNRQAASAESTIALLGAMGIEASSEAAVRQSLDHRRAASSARWLPPCLVQWKGEPRRVGHRMPAGSADFIVTNEEGDVVISRNVAHTESPVLPDLAPGYYSTTLERGSERHTSHLLVAPTRLPTHAAGWGVFAPTYALRRRDIGGASLTELQVLASWVAELGGSAVATLPLLSAFLGEGREPVELSPYRPVSREFWNEAFLDVALCDNFEHCESARRIAGESERIARQVTDFAGARLDMSRLMAHRRPVLAALAADAFQRDPWRRDLLAFVRDRPRLFDYARFRSATAARGGFPRWDAATVVEVDDDDPELVYHLYAQWQLDRQLGALARRGREGGASLYLDLPVGAHPEGFDAYSRPEIFCHGAEAGAPPDALNAGGQCWALPVLHPEAIRNDGHRYWRDCIRAHLRYADVLRIDHVMGMHRLFWVPRGASPVDGAYVSYPAEEQWAVLCIEAQRAGAAVVGENLGTVPDAVNAAIDRHRCHGMSVGIFSFGGDNDRALAPPAAGSVASLGTHDTPTLAGFLAADDIDVQHRLGLIDDGARAQARSERLQLLEHLRGLFVEDELGQQATFERIHDGLMLELSRSEAWMVLVTLEDLWLERAPQNIPGTAAEDGNWSRRLERSLEEVIADEELSRRLAALFGER